MAVYTHQQIIDALEACKGLVYIAARRLGCDPKTIKKRIREVPEVAEAQRNAKGYLKDVTEAQIIKAINEGQPWAIKFFAATQMRDRGYGDRLDHGGSVELTIPFMQRRGDLPVQK
jgi:hypothetical protein